MKRPSIANRKNWTVEERECWKTNETADFHALFDIISTEEMEQIISMSAIDEAAFATRCVVSKVLSCLAQSSLLHCIGHELIRRDEAREVEQPVSAS